MSQAEVDKQNVDTRGERCEENTKLINDLINSMKRVQIHERDKSKDGTHVDWWIYEESDPQNYFKEVKENE